MSRLYLTNLDADVTGYKLALVDMRNPNAATTVVSSTATTSGGSSIQAKAADGTTALKWITKPFLADVAIGALPAVVNVWGKEATSSVNANLYPAFYEYTTSEQATFGASSPAPAELTATMARTTFVTTNLTATTIEAGNRLVIKMFVENTGTMGLDNVGVTMDFDGATEGADGDTWIGLAETITLSEQQVGSGTFPVNPGYGQGYFQNIIDGLNAAVGAKQLSSSTTVGAAIIDLGYQRDNH